MAAIFAVAPHAADAAERKKVVTSVVSASIDKSYRRAKNPDGSFKPEYYALSYGGQAKGTTSHESIDRMELAEFAKLVQEQLAKHNYLLAPDAESAGLLIHLLWGVTDPLADNTNLKTARNTAASSMTALKATGVDAVPNFRGAWGLPVLTPEQREAVAQAEGDLIAMIVENRVREQALAPTASLLGYIDAVNDLTGDPSVAAGLGPLYADLWDEISARRYYVVIYAYDFKLLQRDKKLKPLWVTRVSIEAGGNKFDEHVAGMVARAGHYFGRQTRGLERTFEGRVEVGEPEVIGVVGDEPTDNGAPPDRPTEPANDGSSEPATTSAP